MKKYFLITTVAMGISVNTYGASIVDSWMEKAQNVFQISERYKTDVTNESNNLDSVNIKLKEQMKAIKKQDVAVVKSAKLITNILGLMEQKAVLLNTDLVICKKWKDLNSQTQAENCKTYKDRYKDIPAIALKKCEEEILFNKQKNETCVAKVKADIKTHAQMSSDIAIIDDTLFQYASKLKYRKNELIILKKKLQQNIAKGTINKEMLAKLSKFNNYMKGV